MCFINTISLLDFLNISFDTHDTEKSKAVIGQPVFEVENSEQSIYKQKIIIYHLIVVISMYILYV